MIARLLFLVCLVAGVVAAQSAPPRKDIPAIAKAANGAIVTVITATGDKPIAQGTGFLVSADGVIVTNYHVIKEGNVAVVKFPDGTVLPVDGVLAANKVRDLAVIKIHGKTFRTLMLGNSDQIQVGEEVIAIGNPLGLELTVSNGIISGVRTSKEQGGKFLQTTAPISPGSSGGPLFNMLGEVVGINTMYLEGGENLNFAIPVNDAKLLLSNQSAKLQNLPNEPKPTKVQARNGHALSPEIDAPTVFFDDISYPKVGNEFSAAFALEPSCSGLSLMTWMNHTDEERGLGMEKSEWNLTYYPIGAELRHGAVYHYHRHMPPEFDFEVDFGAVSPEEAARKVCSIIKSHGGKIR